MQSLYCAHQHHACCLAVHQQCLLRRPTGSPTAASRDPHRHALPSSAPSKAGGSRVCVVALTASYSNSSQGFRSFAGASAQTASAASAGRAHVRDELDAEHPPSAPRPCPRWSMPTLVRVLDRRGSALTVRGLGFSFTSCSDGGGAQHIRRENSHLLD